MKMRLALLLLLAAGGTSSAQDGTAEAKDDLVDSRVDVVDMNGTKVVRHLLLADDPCYDQKDAVRQARAGLAAFRGQNDAAAKEHLARAEQAARACIASPPGPPPPSPADVSVVLGRIHQRLWQELNAPFKSRKGTPGFAVEQRDRDELRKECDALKSAQRLISDGR